MLQNGVGCRTSSFNRDATAATLVLLTVAMAVGLALAIPPLCHLVRQRHVTQECWVAYSDPLDDRRHAGRKLLLTYARLGLGPARPRIACQSTSNSSYKRDDHRSLSWDAAVLEVIGHGLHSLAIPISSLQLRGLSTSVRQNGPPHVFPCGTCNRNVNLPGNV